MRERTMSIDGYLEIASRELRSRLKGLPGLKVKKKYKSEKPDTKGRCTILAEWGKGMPEVELWLDKSAGPDLHRFWFGFATEDEIKLKRFVAELPKELVPKRKYTEKDWKSEGKGQKVMVDPKEAELTQPYLEMYPKEG
jgi:hypothetical protein